MVTARSHNIFLSLTLYLCSQNPPAMQAPHCYILPCGWSLCISCRAAEGVAEGCISQVLLLTDQPVIYSVAPALFSKMDHDVFRLFTKRYENT